MRGEQGCEALAQGWVAVTFGVEPRRAFRSGLAQCKL